MPPVAPRSRSCGSGVDAIFGDLHFALVTASTIGLDRFARWVLHWADENGNTTLHHAVLHDNVPCVRFICATVTKRGGEWLDFLDRQNTAGRTAMHLVAELGRTECADALLTHGASVSPGVGKTLTPLHVALMYRRRDCAELLLKFGADVQARGAFGETALHCAVGGSADLIETLLGMGASVNDRDIGLCTPLHHAAWQGCEQSTEALVRGGADLDAKHAGGDTALHIAATGKLGVLRILLDAGASPGSVDTNGNTPLHIAVEDDSREANVAELLERVTELRAVNERGETPLVRAVSSGSLSCAALVAAYAPPETASEVPASALAVARRRLDVLGDACAVASIVGRIEAFVVERAGDDPRTQIAFVLEEGIPMRDGRSPFLFHAEVLARAIVFRGATARAESDSGALAVTTVHLDASPSLLNVELLARWGDDLSAMREATVFENDKQREFGAVVSGARECVRRLETLR